MVIKHIADHICNLKLFHAQYQNCNSFFFFFNKFNLFTIQTLTLLMLLTMPYHSYITNNTSNTYTYNTNTKYKIAILERTWAPLPAAFRKMSAQSPGLRQRQK